MKRFVVALFLLMLVSAGFQVLPWKPLKKAGKAVELVKIAHADWIENCNYCDKIPKDCFCKKIYHGNYRKAKIAWARIEENRCKCAWAFCSDDTEYCDPQCTQPSQGGSCSGDVDDQCQYDSDCINKHLGKYCCATADGNKCWDCPCNDPNCNGGGGGSGGGNGCDVTPPTGLSASPSYTSASITWSHGHNDHQELFVDPDHSKVENDCANGCFLKKTDLAYSANAYTVTGLQQGTTYYYKIVSVKDCDSKAAESSFTTLACDVTAPTGLHASPSYNYSILTWTPGHNSHQELYLDTDKARVDNNCANGCLLKLPAMGYARKTYTVRGLQPGTTYYYKIVSARDCGSKSAEGSFNTTPPIVVPSVRFINRQHFTTKDPPAAFVCFINHDDNGALYAVEAGHRLQRHGSVYRSRSGRLYAYFIPSLTPGHHHVECRVNRSLAMGTGNSGDYNVNGPFVEVEAGNSVIGLPAEVVASASSDFYINSTRLFVDGSPVGGKDYRGQHLFGVNSTWYVPLLPGSHEISVKAVDYVGNEKESSAAINVSDAAVSCEFSPETIDSDTDFSVTCYDMSGAETACPNMHIYLEDQRAGSVSNGQGAALPLPRDLLCFLWRFCVFCGFSAAVETAPTACEVALRRLAAFQSDAVMLLRGGVAAEAVSRGRKGDCFAACGGSQ